MIRFPFLVLLWALGGPALASDWVINEAPGLFVKSEGPTAPNGLPDGHVALHPDHGDIAKAWYSKPTDRYGHAILGDGIEAGELTVETADGRKLTFELPDNQVFEDRTPRLRDLDGFGRVSVVTILSDSRLGASIAIFGLADDKLTLIAQTPYIGRSNRWRNIAAIDDFSGDGSIEIAEVVTPHIGGILKFWRWSKGELLLVGEANGFSNHFIGSREQRLSAVEDFDGDGVADLALPDARRRSVRIMKLGDEGVAEIANIPLPARLDKAMAADGGEGGPKLTIGLENGSILSITK